MPYIKPGSRQLLDGLVDGLIQAAEGDDGKLNYAISRLVAGSYAKDGKWSYKLIQRAVGLLHCVAMEFYHRVAVPYEGEAAARNGDIKEYDEADGQFHYKMAARRAVERFSASGTFKRGEFDQMISNNSTLDRIDDFTNRLHADGYIVMHPETVTLGLLGLELRNAKH